MQSRSRMKGSPETPRHFAAAWSRNGRGENATDRMQIAWFDALGCQDVARVGGKNASLGEMVRKLAAQGVSVPPGFATTADAYWSFVDENGLRELISVSLGRVRGRQSNVTGNRAGGSPRLHQRRLPADTVDAIRNSYNELSKRCGVPQADVAVRSSAGKWSGVHQQRQTLTCAKPTGMAAAGWARTHELLWRLLCGGCLHTDWTRG